MTKPSVYDMIGGGYRLTRKEDPRIASAIFDALEDSPSVVNVGAGTGSYEPTARLVVAVEPSPEMIGQRPHGSALVIRAVAESLPLVDGAVAAALAVLTVHHWQDQDRGLRELSRVARDRGVIFTWDPSGPGFWLTDEYFPGFIERDRERCPTVARLRASLWDAEVITVPIPHDGEDGFLGAYWRRPAAYLDPAVRSGISSFALGTDLSPLDRLARDLDSGEWEARHASLLTAEQLDLGYRIVVGRPKKI
jgi:SAM-dependent methyltransferase